MAVYTTKDTDLTKVADAIRDKGGTTDKLSYPDGMVEAIEAIPSGGTDTLAEYISNSTYEYEVPATVTKLANQAFRNMTRLTKISFKGKTEAPNDSSLFNGCSNLVSADLKNLVMTNHIYMNYWFYQCSKLTSVDLTGLDTSSVITMNYMFSGCSVLPSIDITSLDTHKVTSLEGFAPYCGKLTSLDLSKFDCTSLTAINSLVTNDYSLISIPGFTSMDLSKITSGNASTTFYGCTRLEWDKDYVNNSLKYIGTQCFYNCYLVKLKKISAVLESIGNSAFQNCKALTTLWVPATCTSIGSSAFNGSGLTDFYTPLTERPSGWNANAFPSTVTIHYGVSEEEYDALISAAE
jgi:surface protein